VNRGVERVALVLTAVAVLGSSHCQRDKSSSTRATSAASAPRQPVDLPAPAKADPLPLAVGQWQRTRTTERGRDDVTQSLKIVAQDAGAFWFEVVTGTADAGTVVQVLMDPKDRRDKAAADIRAAKVRMPNGLIRELNGPLLEPNKPGYRALLDKVFMMDRPPIGRADVTVPAGTFKSCFLFEIEKVKYWVHPGVPLTGIVKSEAGGLRVELVDFGLDGALSELEQQKH